MTVAATPRESPTLAEINITPLVDVMLVLLIIFMIAAPVLAHRTTLDLPQPVPLPPPPDVVNLDVRADGRLSWNQQPLLAAALEPQLRHLATRRPDAVLAIRADDRTAYEAVARVLATAQHVGVAHLALEQGAAATR